MTMATMKNSCKPPSHRAFLLSFLLAISSANLSSSQSSSPSNVQTYYPYTYPPPPANESAPAPAPDQNYTLPISPPPPPPPRVSPIPSKTSKKKIITAVAATAASTLVVAGVFFLLCSRCFLARRRKQSSPVDGAGDQRNPLPPAVVAAGSRSEFTRFGGNIKGLIVDEDGLDVLYWKKLKNSSGGFHKEPFHRAVPRGRSSSSQSQIHPGRGYDDRSSGVALQAVATSGGGQPPPGRPALSYMAVSTSPAPPPPPPPPPEKKIPPIPPPPPVPAKKTPTPLPPALPKPPSGGSKTPVAVAKEEGSGSGKDQVTLKPLHWEKVNINPDHSMVWDKVERGSFQYNGDMMEALFGVVAINRRSPKEENPSIKIGEPSNPSAKIFILDQRKSQNTAIVIKSLGVPRDELIDSLLEGKGLSIETLEKLARIVPTREEETEILGFNGDPAKLADAESFLYSLLKAVPSAFTRANAMLFKLSYDSEILNIHESLQTLESACNELRSRRIFLKLLEAILKAGNRLNAGTARGDAKAFNLSTLLKLSDYKSSDGKTTLLHFVVHEVVRNEGRRCILARNKSVGRQNDAGSASQSEDPAAKDEKEKEFLKLGLPVVGGLSLELSNVKEAASVDYDALRSTLASLTTRVDETRQLVAKCSSSGGGGGGGFLQEMKAFLESAEMEVKAIQEEHTRVMDFVKKTTQYYQSGASNDKNPLQLFVIVKDFLGMVDQTCVEIARSLQQKKPPTAAAGSGSSSQPDLLRTRVTFPRLPDHFLSDKSSTSGSEDDS